MTLAKPLLESLTWKKSLFWILITVACFHAAYTSLKAPAAGVLILGYALGLVRLADQPNVRRAFYTGLVTGFLCYAPQLWFFWKIFSMAAVVLWLVLAFWVGLFTAIGCGCLRRWGTSSVLLLPILWTGIEYFRSELYLLKFSWLSIGYAVPNIPIAAFGWLGMYGVGFVIFFIVTLLVYGKSLKKIYVYVSILMLSALASLAWLTPARAEAKTDADRPKPKTISIVGIQTEFPPVGVLPKLLDHAAAKNTNAQIFILSEYTLDGPVPDALKNWCRNHARYLVVGGKDPMGTNNYYNTAFVIDTNGDIVFKQVKSVPIQFFKDGLPAPEQKVWESPWGKIGFCVCYDLSYTRVIDRLVCQGAQLLIVPTMDVEYWGRHQHELHTRVAPVRAAEYGVPIFRLASSGISQAVTANGEVIAQAPTPGTGAMLAAKLSLAPSGSLPLDRAFAPVCTILAGIVTATLLLLTWRERRTVSSH